MSRILLTGASGFVGSALLPALVERGAHVRVLARGQHMASYAGDVILHRGDLTNADSLRGLAKNARVVFHLAGYAHAVSRPDPAEIDRHRRINLEGTRNLFREAAAAGVQRFVFVSSVKAIGEDPVRCLDEDHALPPADPYGRIKREIEDWLFDAGARHSVEVVVVRPALVYGPGVKGNLAAMLRAIDRGWFPPLPETGNVRSMVGVQDLVDALLRAATCDRVGMAPVITDGEAYSTHRIYRSMATALGRRVPPVSIPPRLLRGLGRLGDVAERVSGRALPINSTLAARLLESACYRSVLAESALGFRPRQRLEDVLDAMVAAYRAGR